MINTFIGPMHSGKSDALISIYKKIYKKDLIMAFKPSLDKRDGGYIKSKNYDESIPAIVIDDLSEIIEHIKGKNIHTIFIDEMQMLSGDVSILIDLSVIYDIDFYIAGLNMTGEQKIFGIMGEVLAASDNITFISGFCEECNKQANFTYFKGDSMENDVMIGDELYQTLCINCLRKKLLIKSRGKVKELI